MPDLKEEHPWQREQQGQSPGGGNKHGLFISPEGQPDWNRANGRESRRLVVKGWKGPDHTWP